jgi:hypothetical protein
MPEVPIPAPSGNPRLPCSDDRTENWTGILAMNAILFGAAAHQGFGKKFGKASGKTTDEPKPEKPLDAAWIVLEAANDLGDQATVEVCRRVIDASLNGRSPSPSDINVVIDYFR